MLGEEPIWRAAAACHEALAEAGAPHAVIGGVAVCLHGYRRNTVDVDLLVRPEDTPLIRDALTAAGFTLVARETPAGFTQAIYSLDGETFAILAFGADDLAAPEMSPLADLVNPDRTLLVVAYVPT